MAPLGTQIVWLFILPIPVACVAWTVTHEEIFREPREYCLTASRGRRSIWQRKFFYVFTCEYCFSHYVTALALVLTGYHLLLPDGRGLLLAWFGVVWVANQYMSLYGRLRLDIREEQIEIREKEEAMEAEPLRDAGRR